jgi:hypothetical protein
MVTWAPPPPVLVRPPKIVGYRVLTRKSPILVAQNPAPWVSVQSLFPTPEGARAHLRKLLADHLMICEKVGVGSSYDIAIQAVKDDGSSEDIESIGLSIVVGGQIV